MPTPRRQPQDHKPKTPAPAPVAGPRYVLYEGRRIPIIDQDTLTWADLEQIEEEFEQDWDSMRATRSSVALIWLSIRRQVAGVTVDQVRALNVTGSVERPTTPSQPAVEGPPDPPVPTEAAAAPEPDA
jgi:hypothetical protein